MAFRPKVFSLTFRSSRCLGTKTAVITDDAPLMSQGGAGNELFFSGARDDVEEDAGHQGAG